MYYNFQFHGKIVHIFFFRDGDQKYVVISGIVSIPISPVDSSGSTAKNDQVMMVAIVVRWFHVFLKIFLVYYYLTNWCNFTNFCFLQVPKLDDNIRVKARMTFTQTYISAISYSKPMPKNLALDKKDFVENEAINVGFQFIFLREIENYTQ